MKVHFQLTYQEYREANFGSAGWSAIVPAIISWCIALGFLLILIVPSLYPVIETDEATQPELTSSGQRLEKILTDAGAGLLLLGLPMVAVVAALFKQPIRVWKPIKPSTGAKVRGILVVIIGAVAVFWLLEKSSGSGLGRAAAMLPVGLFYLLSLAVVVVNHVRTPWNQWRAQSHLQLPTSLEVSGSGGLTFRHERATLHYEWVAIEGYRETENLLLLYLSPLSFWVVPKRSFVSLTELAQFKQVLADHVAEGAFISGGQGFTPAVSNAAVPYASAVADVPPPLPRPVADGSADTVGRDSADGRGTGQISAEKPG